MKIFPITLVTLALAALPACNRATESDCRTAVQNIYDITGVDQDGLGPDPQKWVRSCRARASRAAVRCMIDAHTMSDLQACEGGLADELQTTAGGAPQGGGAPPADH
jgi:hypothetical protein